MKTLLTTLVGVAVTVYPQLAAAQEPAPAAAPAPAPAVDAPPAAPAATPTPAPAPGAEADAPAPTADPAPAETEPPLPPAPEYPATEQGAARPLQAPPPPPPPPADGAYDPYNVGARTHDGFYLRLALGLGGSTVTTTAAGADLELDYSGTGGTFNFALGGTLGAGFVLGVMLTDTTMSDPKVEASAGSMSVFAGEVDGNLGITQFELMVDWFFDEQAGGHIGLGLGFGAIGLEDDSEELAGGGSGSLFGGYDFWVSDEWSLGVLGQVGAVWAERKFDNAGGDSFTTDDTANTFSIAFTALYH